MAAVVSLCPSLTLKLSRNQNQAQPFASSPSKYSLSLLSHSFSSSLTLNSRKQQQPTLSFFVPKSTGTDTAEVESPVVDVESVAEQAKPKHEEVFAVVMVSSRETNQFCFLLCLVLEMFDFVTSLIFLGSYCYMVL